MWVGLVTAVVPCQAKRVFRNPNRIRSYTKTSYLSIGYHSLLAIPGVDYRESVKVVRSGSRNLRSYKRMTDHDWVNPSWWNLKSESEGLKVLLPSFEIKGAYLDALQACRDTIMLWNSARDFGTSCFLCSTLSTNAHALLFGNQGLASWEQVYFRGLSLLPRLRKQWKEQLPIYGWNLARDLMDLPKGVRWKYLRWRLVSQNVSHC